MHGRAEKPTRHKRRAKARTRTRRRTRRRARTLANVYQVDYRGIFFSMD